MSSRTFTARWILPVAGPPLERGTITIRGDRIESVQPRGDRTADQDLGNVAIVPGLVNPHTHLDLSGARGLIPPTDPEHFTEWLRGVIAYRRSRSTEQVQADIRAGLAECLCFGTTLIGDIAAEGASWDAVSEAKTRAVVFFEVIGLTLERVGAAIHNAFLATQLKPETESTLWGRSPHAPYSVHRRGFAVSLVSGINSIHLAESPPEVEFLADHRGAMPEFLERLGVFSSDGIASGFDEIVAEAASQTLFIHCNYVSPDTPFAVNHSVVYCPRTHAAFGHPTHPFREFLQRGVRVCLGTDSLASNPDLDILAEARFVHEKYPDFPGDQLLRMITLSGAEALGWANKAGSLEPGKSADFVAIPLPNEDGDPHELLFANHTAERRTMFRGQWRSEVPATPGGVYDGPA